VEIQVDGEVRASTPAGEGKDRAIGLGLSGRASPWAVNVPTIGPTPLKVEEMVGHVKQIERKRGGT
jgi:hypothetical protein